MKKLLSIFLTVSMMNTMVISASAGYSDDDLSKLPLYKYEDVDGTVFYQAYGNVDPQSIGYLYLMDDSQSKPAVDEAIALSDIVHEKNGYNKYFIYLNEHAMNKYGDDVYFSTELTEDTTGVAKVIELISDTFSGEGYFDGSFYVSLPYETKAEFEAKEDELIEKINTCVPYDGCGFKFSNNILELGNGKIGTWLQLDVQEEETEISELFNNWKTNPFPIYDLAEAISNEIDAYVTLNYILNSVHYTPQIDTYVYHEDEIKYNLVYSADGSAGDANNDGLLELADVQTLLSHKANSAAGITEPIVSATPDNMDVDGDGEVTIKDAQYLLTYCAQQAAGMNPTWESVINA